MTYEIMDRFRSARSNAQHRLEELASPPIHRLFSTGIDAAELLIISDAHFRQAERCRVFGVRPAQAEEVFAKGKKYNDLLRSMVTEQLPAHIRDLRQHFADMGNVDATENLDRGEQTIRDALADFPLDVYQAQKAESLLRKVFEAGRAGGGSLCDHMQLQIEELGRLRAQREEHNEAVVEIVAGVACLAVAVALMIDCSGKGTCGSAGVFLMITGLLAVAGLLLTAGLGQLLAPAVAAAA